VGSGRTWTKRNPGAVGRPTTVECVALVDRPDHLSGLVRHFERSHAVSTALSEQLRAVGRPLEAGVEVTLPLAARLEDRGQERQPSPVAPEQDDAAIRVERELLGQRDLRRTRARVRRPRRRRRGVRCRTTVEEDEDGDAHGDHERCDRPVPAMATARLSPRLFDQRLDKGFDLFALERLAVGSRACRRGRTRRIGDGHASQRFTNELVLLVH
jgi:hypothetical protein